jgi:hypothetical protein
MAAVVQMTLRVVDLRRTVLFHPIILLFLLPKLGLVQPVVAGLWSWKTQGTWSDDSWETEMVIEKLL